MKQAIILVYKTDTGEKVREIPLNFWFSHAEGKIEDRHFIISQENIELKEDESATIILPLSIVLNEILMCMRAF